jgi:hypothetical protein
VSLPKSLYLDTSRDSFLLYESKRPINIPVPSHSHFLFAANAGHALSRTFIFAHIRILTERPGAATRYTVTRILHLLLKNSVEVTLKSLESGRSNRASGWTNGEKKGSARRTTVQYLATLRQQSISCHTTNLAPIRCSIVRPLRKSMKLNFLS